MWAGLILRGMAVHTSFGAGLERAAQLWRVAVLLACAEDIAREELRVQLSPTDITDITIRLVHLFASPMSHFHQID